LVSQAPQPNQSSVITDNTALNQMLTFKVKKLTSVAGELILPCIPSFLDYFTQQISILLLSLGQNFTAEELTTLRNALGRKLEEGFQASPDARVSFRYKLTDPALGLNGGVELSVNLRTPSTVEEYQGWAKNREGPLFGSHPDAKVMAIAKELGDPASAKILDVGAGPGRNTIPLARVGFPVDALELTPVFAEQISNTATAEGLNIGTIVGDVLDPNLKLESAQYKLVIVAEVISHFRNLEQVKQLFIRLCDTIQPGGLLLFSTFLTIPSYEPSKPARELSQIAWSYIITPNELLAAMAGLPLEFISNESVFLYERQHLPAEAWPPTNWFASWSMGRDVFPTDKEPPISLRWILCRRK
jgi:2-polyprenyl-3-methyl-5-hydroxy-6-metoxy-1,4-benzoquinol methylase